jgi:hypothetical protein
VKGEEFAIRYTIQVAVSKMFQIVQMKEIPIFNWNGILGRYTDGSAWREARIAFAIRRNQ